MNAFSPPEFLTLSNAVLRCWESEDAPILLAAVTESFDHLQRLLVLVHTPEAGRAPA
jgi:hypothetical protein